MRYILIAIVAAAPVVAPALRAQGHDYAHHTAAAAPASPSPTLEAEVEAVRRATERYRDIEVARREGYRLFGMEGPLVGEHWYLPEAVRRPLDMARPSTLQYATVDGRKVLVGVAYTYYRRPDEPVPEGFAGAGDVWHTHDVTRLARAATAERPMLRAIVERRIRRGRVGAGDGRTLLTMVHAWVWSENPDGMFAGQHRGLPYLRAGLPPSHAAGASEAAAMGVSLLAADGCADEVRRTDRLAGLSRTQSRDLRRACDRHAEAVRASRNVSAAALNVTAERAWTAYLAERNRMLDPEQRQRMRRVMDAATEPGHTH
ncbi:MAG TPA: hypothetical protein VGX50_10350 [Longimicrobium sp.]|jgi:hypothetical protein|nr:hypothetical protein [Longimicrobium sp.]